MADTLRLDCPELELTLWRLYRDFFDKAEKKRRWSLRDDIPWDQCNRHLDPVIADVVESFCAVELYLPDYVAKVMPMTRNSHGRAWFYANWGYEESKHSMALSDWLLRSGHRTDEQIFDLEATVFEGEWNLPQDSPLGMIVYAMVQEHATWLNYRNLNHRVAERGGDPALSKLLRLVATDEMAHHSFFRQCVELFLKQDRPTVLAMLRQVMNNFAMPAIHELADTRRRIAAIRGLEIFTENIYYRDVYRPLLEALGVEWSEMRNRVPRRKTAGVES